MNHKTQLFDMLRLIPVCANYYLIPFPHPSPPPVFMLGAVGIDVTLKQVGLKVQQVKYGK
jgi:xanthosine utilization system XapX-like protein